MSSLVHTLAPPAPVASPTETICADAVVDDAGGEQVTAGERVGVDDGDDRSAVAAAELVAGVGVGDGQVLGELLAEVERGAGRGRPVGEVGAVAVGFGDPDHGRGRSAGEAGRLDRLGVKSWKSRSAVSMTPPGFERRSMMSPLRGIRRRRSATSSTKPSVWSTSKVHSRR